MNDTEALARIYQQSLNIEDAHQKTNVKLDSALNALAEIKTEQALQKAELHYVKLQGQKTELQLQSLASDSKELHEKNARLDERHKILRYDFDTHKQMQSVSDDSLDEKVKRISKETVEDQILSVEIKISRRIIWIMASSILAMGGALFPLLKEFFQKALVPH